MRFAASFVVALLTPAIPSRKRRPMLSGEGGRAIYRSTATTSCRPMGGVVVSIHAPI